MPLDYEKAYEQTDPNATEEERQASAKALQNGFLANEIYWRQHTDVLTAIQAQIEGHGEVKRGDENPEELPPAGTQVDSTIESSGTAPQKELAASSGAPGASASTAEVTNPNDAIARLRAQLASHDITPEA